ncbi:MAG: biopolymer transport protein ExbB, partial [Candidatus Omnitrophota bacterium]
MYMNDKTTNSWMILTGGLLLSGPFASFAQDAAPLAAAATPGPEKESIFNLILSGGPVMIPLGIASIIALAITFERLSSLKKRKLIPQDFMRGLKEAYDADPVGLDQAVSYCEGHQGPVGRIFKSGLV